MVTQDFWIIYDCGGGENDNMIWLCLIGIVSGIISGMGIGGGAILIPAITFLFDYGQRTAQNINLIYFIPTAIIALITHSKNKAIEKNAVKQIAGWGIIGAIAGAMIAVNLDNDILRILFGMFLLVMGISEFFKGGKKEE